MKKIAVLVSGGGTNLQAIIDAVNEGKIKAEISAVISNRKDAYGLERAKKVGIEALYIQGNKISVDEYDKKLIAELEKRNVDLIVMAGFLKIMGKDFIEHYKNRIVNIHPSLIPSFCGEGFYGIKVHEAAINYGVKVSGATTHFVNEEPDGGPIIMQESVEVDANDTAEDLQKKVLEIEHRILPETIKLFCEDKIEVDGRKVFLR
jgi:phosphoribosylglycinamide formyltransferase-1